MMNTVRSEKVSNAFIVFKKWTSDNLLVIATLSGIILGVILGTSLRTAQLDEATVSLISYPGELFMRILKLMIVPLVIASLITGSAGLNAKANGKIAMYTAIYFCLTSLLNAILGISLALGIHPGTRTFFNGSDHQDEGVKTSLKDSLLDLGRNIFPDNIFQATFQQSRSTYEPIPLDNGTVVYKVIVKYQSGTNTLGIIFFCILFGSVLGTFGKQARLVINFFFLIDKVVMRMVTGIMWLSPIGVSSIICGKMLDVDDLGEMMQKLTMFIMTVVIGVFIYQLIIMQLFYLIIVRKNPWNFYWKMREAWLTVFATASTAATLPISLKCVEEKAGVDRRISRFVLPIGTTVNMDGTALFVAVATVFIAQLNDMHLTLGMLITVCLTATAASIASASVPSAALFLMIMVLQSIDAPVPDTSLLFAVDWLVDRFRSTNNCLGDCYTAAIIEHLCRYDLEALKIIDGDIDHDIDYLPNMTSDVEEKPSINDAIQLKVVVNNDKMNHQAE